MITGTGLDPVVGGTVSAVPEPPPALLACLGLLGLVVGGRMPARELPAYVIAQVLGAIAAAALAIELAVQERAENAARWRRLAATRVCCWECWSICSAAY